MKSHFLKAALLCLLGFSAAHLKAAENQFFIFPLKEIEGLGEKNSAEVRPLVDEQAVSFIKGNQSDVQTDVLNHFTNELNQAYAGSIVHIKQVRNYLKGPVTFVDNDQLTCGESPVVPFENSYAAVIGISRASFTKVHRGLATEVIIPITLNLQIIKVDKAKILFSSSNTTITPFKFGDNELDSPAYVKTIKETLAKNLKDQVTTLVKEAKLNFSPKLTPVKIVGKEGDFYIADKGFEVGFVERDQPIAKDSNGKDVWFKVITAADGYSVLEVQQGGEAKVGQSYQFMFEAKADDSSKPRVMPVVSYSVKNKEMTSINNGVIDLFSKSIGYKAPFQIAPIDVNFEQTMDNIKNGAQCFKDWDKYPLTNPSKNSRDDYPQFILNVDAGETAVFTAKADGGIKENNTFATVVQASVSDLGGVVYGSAIGSYKYEINKQAGMGLSVEDARKVAYKNATESMAADFLKNINFDPKVFRIKAVGSNTLLVENFPIEAGSGVKASVIRKLSIKVNKKDVVIKLPLVVDGSANKKGTDVEVPFEMKDFGKDAKPKVGDSLVVYALPKGNAVNVAMCEGEFLGKNNAISTSTARPILKNLIYNSPKYQVNNSSSELANDVNFLLDAGHFKKNGQMQPKLNSQACLQTGYLVREDKANCAGDTCNAAASTALLVRLVESGQSKKDYIVARKTELKNFVAAEKDNLYSVNAYDQFLSSVPELSKKLNEK